MRHAEDHPHELLGAYVLGACPAPEADRVAEHLAHCAGCSTAVEGLREAAGTLLEGVAPAAPAATVKDRLMTQVRAEAALFDAAREGAYARPKPTAVPPTGSRRWAAVPAVAMASVLVLAAVGAGLLSGGIGSESRRGVVAQISHGQAPGASGSLEIRGEQAELRVRGLPDPGRGRVYQVWVRRDRQVPEPAGKMLELDSRGAARAGLPGDIRRFDQVLVTSEPAGGSPLPTRRPVLDVDTSA